MDKTQVISEKTKTDMVFSLRWASLEAEHEERLFASVNLNRDILPDELLKVLIGKRQADHIEVEFPSGKLFPAYDERQLHTIKYKCFNSNCQLAVGRFYPRGFLRDMPGIYPGMVIPFRCIGLMPDSFSADFNHPMAYYRARLSVDIISVEYYSDPRGGLLKDYGEILGDGPGMQARYRGLPTDFFSESEAFSRENEENDHSFYEKARLVTHVDEQACKIIEDIYGQLLQPEMRVLDLMTRWKSYVPKKIEPISLVGLGLNEEELAANKQLISRHIHDLNTRPVLPFNDGSFDAVICSASVEYLTHPLKIFSEVSRILRPGGLFVHTFSDRWFPPKVIQLWKDLHPFERVGFVTECFLRTGLFERLFTLSVQGWPRPLTDRHYPSLKTSDPVFAVWGYKKE